jgi:hypothetical protein
MNKVLVMGICLSFGLSYGSSDYRDLHADRWVATDALSRPLPGFEECGWPKDNRTVGLFYFLWLGQHGTDGPFDITELLKENPHDPQYGPAGRFHHWGKPELGYYTSDSDYVIRRHAQLLTAAGVDVLIFDVTNAFTYSDIYLKLCGIFTQLRADGQQTPQVMFLANSHPGRTIKTLYDEFYAKKLYPELWFQWQGKPLLLTGATRPADLPPEIEGFFTLRKCWAWTHGRDTWNWLEHWPQRCGWHEAPGKPEQLSVSVAQHPIWNIGRSHCNNKQPLDTDAYGIGPRTHEGLYFAQQWQRALEIDPEFLLITGWNEWVAQRFLRKEGQAGQAHLMMGKPLKDGESFFVDVYNQEFSRDIEPMEGGYGDNYYYQMVAGIRRYKGVRPPRPVSLPKTISIDGQFADWVDVGPEFLDFVSDVGHRDEKGWGKAGRYVNTTGRNDLAVMKVARDDQSVYFYARTAEPLTSRSDSNWMLLFINADRNAGTGWEGYDFVVNLEVSEKMTSLHRLQDGWNPELVATIPYVVKGNQLELAISRAALGLTSECKVSLDFKWADHIQKRGDITEFFINGDAAPERRFNYRFSE